MKNHPSFAEKSPSGNNWGPARGKIPFPRSCRYRDERPGNGYRRQRVEAKLTVNPYD